MGGLLEPVAEEGLFSYGMKIAFDETRARVESASSVSIRSNQGSDSQAQLGSVQHLRTAMKASTEFERHSF